MTFNPLLSPFSLTIPNRLTDINSWHPHLPFAFALIDIIRPEVFVELGTHKGDSYCGFCQAVDALDVPTRCFAVDTWLGDAQASFYDESVFSELKSYHDERYARFSTLVRSTFDDANAKFRDGEIDLLHLDGLHTYEAVKHDFECWLPKMSNRGVVLIHDISELQPDFGVWRLWKDLKDRFPALEFNHGHGLGVIAVGQVPAALDSVFSDRSRAQSIARLFARVGQLVMLEGAGGLNSLAELGVQVERIQWLEAQLTKLKVDHEEVQVELRVGQERLEVANHQADQLRSECAVLQDDFRAKRAQDELHWQHERAALQDDLRATRAQDELHWQHERAALQDDFRATRAQDELHWQHERAAVLDELSSATELVGERTTQAQLTERQLADVMSARDRAILDLRSLQSTRTVRVSRLIGEVLRRAVSWPRSFVGRRPMIEGEIDLPKPGASSPPRLTVEGWAISRAAKISSVEILLQETNALVGFAHYGRERPDVLGALPWLPNAACGFSSTVDVTAAPPGKKKLIVRISDELGNVRSLDRTFISTSSGALAQRSESIEQGANRGPVQRGFGAIERAEMTRGRLEVEGWALWSEHTEPRMARVFLGGTLLGETRVWLSRPDIAVIYPDAPGRFQSGFRFQSRTELTDQKMDASTQVIVSLSEGGGNQFRIALGLSCDRQSGEVSNPRVFEEFIAAVSEFRIRYGHDPAILNVDSGLRLFEEYPQFTVFSPATDARRLPYLDRSVDLVVVAANDQARLGDARRVAKSVIVGWPRSGADSDSSSTPSTPTVPSPDKLKVEWLSAADYQLPSVSLIIPIFDAVEYARECLAAVRHTLPRCLDAEVVVVDDGSSDATSAEVRSWETLDNRIRVLRNERNLGFVESCNRGAKAAIGDILVFLNSDTLPRPGWLEALLSTFQAYPDAGAVGGKLLYPDGSLQEAGCVIFSDGSGANVGRGEQQPDAPCFNFVRVVDYCSGALLATPHRLFSEIGGFDQRYRPAYYEDSDYCFAVRERGYKVYYQPASEIVHVEGGTAGTDLNAGQKQYQVGNRLKFREKWARVLQRYSRPPDKFDPGQWRALVMRGTGEA